MRKPCFCVFLVLAALGAGAVPVRAAGITWTCPSSKTTFCDRAWVFDQPDAVATCEVGGGYVDLVIVNTTTSGVCPRVVTRTWQGTDYCGNTSFCSQVVTLVDTTAPAAVCSGVNLVPNPGFESYASCPTFFGQVPLAGPWFNPSVATPDYFNTCAAGTFVHAPTNFAGQQAPLSGNAYAGTIVFYQTSNDAANSYREYLQVPLIAPLVAGQAYRVSFYVSLSESSSWAIAELGAYLSTTSIVSLSGQNTFQVTPQIVNPSTNLLTSTASWMLVEGTFNAAGGEAWLTLGNFLSDSNTTETAAAGAAGDAYYYYDEVSVVAICPPEATNKTVICGTPWSFDPPVAVDHCSGTNVTVAVAATVTNTACPLTLTRVWSLTDTCGNTGVWRQAVTVADLAPPTVNCLCLEDANIPALNVSGCSAAVPDLCQFTNCFGDACGPVTCQQFPAAGTMVGPGSHSITVTVADCAANVSTCVVPFHVTAPQPMLHCLSNLVVLTCSNNATVHFTATAFSNVGQVVFSPPSGSVFPLGTTPVTCTATNACGGVAECTFTVTVKPPKLRWGCWPIQVGIGVPYDVFGGATAAVRPQGDGYPALTVDPNASNPTNGGVVLQPGPAEALRFTTVLDHSVPAGAILDVVPAAVAMDPDPAPLLRIHSLGTNGFGLRPAKRLASDPSGLFRAIAVDTNGNLFSSVTFTAAEALTNDILLIEFMNGMTSCHVTVETDLATGGTSVEFPGILIVNAARKGWDGCIYGPDRPRPKPPKTARVIIVPPVSPGLPPIGELALRGSGWPSLQVEEPQITMKGRKWSDGHVTLMKAYDDGESGVEFVAGDAGGGVSVDLGFASNLEFRVTHMQGSEALGQEQIFSFRGWPEESTNRLRLAQSGGGLWIDCAVDFTGWGITNVTVQLWDGGSLVGENVNVPAHLTAPLVTLDAFPEIIGCPGVGVLSLRATNTLAVFSGFDCGGPPCIGTELRIIAQPEAGSSPPAAFTGLDLQLSDGMDQRLHDLWTTPACAPVPLSVVRTADGVTVSWSGDGFRLQGAEQVHGPWHDLGVLSPVQITKGSPLRVFRLWCQ